MIKPQEPSQARSRAHPLALSPHAPLEMHDTGGIGTCPLGRPAAASSDKIPQRLHCRPSPSPPLPSQPDWDGGLDPHHAGPSVKPIRLALVWAPVILWLLRGCEPLENLSKGIGGLLKGITPHLP